MQPGAARRGGSAAPDTDRSINADDLDRHMHEDRAGFGSIAQSRTHLGHEGTVAAMIAPAAKFSANLS
jgi:hypothetical protein